MRSKGWVPKQHGAWAMLVVPYLLGLVGAARASAVGWGHLALFVFWMLGYVRPLLVYSGATALAGVVTLVLVGARPLPWVLAFLPLMLPALWLAGRRRERATVGGLLTIAAASLMVPVARHLYPSDDGDWPTVAAQTVLVFAYFFGTVLFVKTNIRERGSRGYLVASIAYHALAVLLAAALVAAALAGWWWVAVLGAALVRAVVVPPLRWRPMPLGMIEVVLSAAIVLGALLLG